MPNPWTKKNPAMGLFLSGADAWAGKARGIWTKEARRQRAAVMSAAGAKQVASSWTAAPTPPASGGKTRKPRR